MSFSKGPMIKRSCYKMVWYKLWLVPKICFPEYSSGQTWGQFRFVNQIYKIQLDAVFQITDRSQVNDLTVIALWVWPNSLSSAKPKIFVNFPRTWQSFPGHHCYCFTGCSQHHALESIYEWTLIMSIWVSNSPHMTASHTMRGEAYVQ